jgi:hypothetical protein
MDIFAVQLAIIFLPGIIWTRLSYRYGAKSTSNNIDTVINSFIFGIITYVALYGIYSISNFDFSIMNIEGKEKKIVFTSNYYDEILFSIPLSLILGTIWVALTNHKVVTRVFQYFGITKRFGDEDVWDFVLNSPDAAAEYVHVRDFGNSLVYSGWITAYSESGKIRELLLRDVQIYDSEGTLSEVPRVYLARDANNIHLEFPYREEERDP